VRYPPPRNRWQTVVGGVRPRGADSDRYRVSPRRKKTKKIGRFRAKTSGTDSSNSFRSATESCLCGFSARIGEIARACGFICVTDGTGEKYFPVVRAKPQMRRTTKATSARRILLRSIRTEKFHLRGCPERHEYLRVVSPSKKALNP
jgi:hypothetical protein